MSSLKLSRKRGARSPKSKRVRKMKAGGRRSQTVSKNSPSPSTVSPPSPSTSETRFATESSATNTIVSPTPEALRAAGLSPDGHHPAGRNSSYGFRELAIGERKSIAVPDREAHLRLKRALARWNERNRPARIALCMSNAAAGYYLWRIR